MVQGCTVGSGELECFVDLKCQSNSNHETNGQ